jgi:NAD(P)-dependent dehydrogenase (short-subunit alcohol dehydrogenase family)
VLPYVFPIVNRYGVRADYVPADLSKVTEIDSLYSRVIELYPDGIDILVNNAGKQC